MKKLSVILAAQLIFSLIFAFPADTHAADKAKQLNNIVLFAQYDSLDDHNFMAERTDTMVDLCNKADDLHSLNGYINAISYGQLNVTSYFPQMTDGVIVPYKLQGSQSDYANCEQYAIEMLRNIAVSKDIPLDGDNDGIVDNVILVIEGSASDMDSPIWSKMFTSPGSSINGVSVGTVNIQNSHQLFEDIISGGEGVLCHEFLHSIGYPDLYRHRRSGTPVGMWDIMASNSVFLQYPLAYNRAAVSGWLDWQVITEDGEYTLSPASESSGNRLYLLKTPLSDTEFFAVEYRKQGAKYSRELDVKIYGSGLCVYRVNTEIVGNFKSEMDGIYVFRPDETAVDAAAGDLTRSCYGGEKAPDHIGSLDWNDDISDGALVYSNGTNSGIMLSDIKMNGDKLTFTAEFADRTDVALWESIDSSKLGKFLPRGMVTSPDGTVYVTTADDGKAALFKVSGSTLEAMGGTVGAGTYGAMNEPKTLFCGDTPYMLYRDKNFLLHLAKLDTSGNWADAYKGSDLAQYADGAVIGSKIYMAYTKGSFPYVLYGAVYDTEAGKTTELGALEKSNVCNLSAASFEGAFTVAYRDLSDGNRAKIAMYTDTGWTVTTISDTDCGAVTMTSEGDIAWVSPWGAGNAVYRVNSGNIEKYPLPENVSEKAFSQTVFTAGDLVFTAVNTQNPDELAVYELKNGQWTAFGDVLAREVVNDPSFLYSGDSIFCSFYTLNGTPIIKRLKIGETAPDKLMGDVNADGKFSVADLVLLSEYLLGKYPLTDNAAGDMSGDGVIDTFDLCIMRRELVKIQ